MHTQMHRTVMMFYIKARLTAVSAYEDDKQKNDSGSDADSDTDNDGN